MSAPWCEGGSDRCPDCNCEVLWGHLSPPYSTIVVDPPWPQQGAGSLCGREGFLDSGGPSRPMPYRTMPLQDIAAMPVGALAAPDSHLYLWTTNGFLGDAFEVMRTWGFAYSTTLVWAKAPMGKGLGWAYGISTEFVLVGRRGSLAAKQRIGRTWFDWKRPYDDRGKPMHSAKPHEFFQVVELVSPGPYVELFARRQRNGWDGWGDQYEAAS